MLQGLEEACKARDCSKGTQREQTHGTTNVIEIVFLCFTGNYSADYHTM